MRSSRPSRRWSHWRTPPGADPAFPLAAGRRPELLPGDDLGRDPCVDDGPLAFARRRRREPLATAPDALEPSARPERTASS
jgi:hypothetical protein